MKKAFVVFLALLMLFTVSCTDAGRLIEDASEAVSETGNVSVPNGSSEEGSPVLFASSLADYRIVVPAHTTDEEQAVIVKLLESVNDDFEIVLAVKRDSAVSPAEKEILLGSTDRSESQTIRSTLKYDDYFIGMQGEKLVVLGGNPTATARAIQNLTAIVSANKGSEIFFSNAVSKTIYRHRYPLADLKINGVSVSEYALVYHASLENREDVYAEVLQKAILSVCGICVPILDTLGKMNGGIIYVGISDTQAKLTADEDMICVCGTGQTDLFYATQVMAKRITSSANGNVTVRASEALSYRSGDLDLSAYGVYPEYMTVKVMSYNVQNAGNDRSGESSHDAKYQKIAAKIIGEGAGIVALQECAKISAVNGILSHLPGYAAYAVEGIHPVILYNTALYERVAQDNRKIGAADDANGSKYDRYLFWAKFRCKDSGKEFVVESVHIDYVVAACRAQLRAIVDFMRENFPDTPTILLGDFNLTESGLDVQYLTNAGYSDARKTAASAQNRNEPTFPKKGTIIDFIFAKGFTALSFKTLTAENNPSDHLPVCSLLAFR